MGEVGQLDVTGTESAAAALREAATLARAGERIAAPALPGDAGSLTAAFAEFGRADEQISTAIADTTTRLADQLDDVTRATVDADRAAIGFR